MWCRDQGTHRAGTDVSATKKSQQKPTAHRPRKSHRPAAQSLPLRTIRQGAGVVRIFDAEKAAAGGYAPFDFNPTLVEDRPEIRGRYSARKTKSPSEWYSYLYVGENVADERVAILECIDLLSLGRSSDRVKRLIDVGSISNLAFAYTTIARNVTLLDISTMPNADIFLADFEVLQGSNYRLTRRWGRYFRSVAQGIDGLYYMPVRYRSTEYGGNIVLFSPHGTHGDQLSRDAKTALFSEDAGLWRLRALEEYINLTFVDMSA